MRRARGRRTPDIRREGSMTPAQGKQSPSGGPGPATCPAADMIPALPLASASSPPRPSTAAPRRLRARTSPGRAAWRTEGSLVERPDPATSPPLDQTPDVAARFQLMLQPRLDIPRRRSAHPARSARLSRRAGGTPVSVRMVVMAFAGTALPSVWLIQVTISAAQWYRVVVAPSQPGSLRPAHQDWMTRATG